MLEVVICSAILLTAVLAGSSAQLDASRAMAEAQQTNIAVGVLQSAMDRVQETSLADLLSGAAPFAIDGEMAFADPILRDQRVLVEAPDFVLGSAPRSLEIRLRLEFMSSTGRPREMQLSGLIR